MAYHYSDTYYHTDTHVYIHTHTHMLKYNIKKNTHITIQCDETLLQLGSPLTGEGAPCGQSVWGDVPSLVLSHKVLPDLFSLHLLWCPGLVVGHINTVARCPSAPLAALVAYVITSTTTRTRQTPVKTTPTPTTHCIICTSTTTTAIPKMATTTT